MNATESRIMVEIMLHEDSYGRSPTFDYLHRATGVRRHQLLAYLRDMEGEGMVERNVCSAGITYSNTYVDIEILP